MPKFHRSIGKRISVAKASKTPWLHRKGSLRALIPRFQRLSEVNRALSGAKLTERDRLTYKRYQKWEDRYPTLFKELGGVLKDSGRLMDILDFLVTGRRLPRYAATYIARGFMVRRDAAQFKVGHTQFIGRASSDGLVTAYATMTNAPKIFKIEIAEEVKHLPEYVRRTMIHSAVCAAAAKARRILYDEEVENHEDALQKLFDELNKAENDPDAHNDLNPINELRDEFAEYYLYPDDVLNAHIAEQFLDEADLYENPFHEENYKVSDIRRLSHYEALSRTSSV